MFWIDITKDGFKNGFFFSFNHRLAVNVAFCGILLIPTCVAYGQVVFT